MPQARIIALAFSINTLNRSIVSNLGVKDGTYHVVDRWSPDKCEVHSLGIMMLIDLAKLKLLYQEVY